MLLARPYSRTKEDHESVTDHDCRNREASAFLFRWRFEISNVEITDDEAGENMVVSCESHGTTIATEPFSSKTRAGQLQTVLGFDTVLYSKSNLLDEPMENFVGPTRGEGTSETSLACLVESFVVRLAVRASTSTGELIDCMALDLSAFVAKSESGKDLALELQVGGVIHTRLACNLLGRADAHNHSIETSFQPRVTVPQVVRFDSTDSAESLSEERVGDYLNTFRTFSLEGDDTEDGREEKRDSNDKASLRSPERLSMVSATSEQNQSSNEDDANSDGANSFSQDFGFEIQRASSSPDPEYDCLAPPGDSPESGSDEGDGSIPNRIVVTTHPLTSLVTARYTQGDYHLCGDIPSSERPITTHVRTPKPLGTYNLYSLSTQDLPLALCG